jgi:crotonobetainyl-CoA:carnitine CoA-transferase CaiB-like acyl-CoA transferase
VTGATGPLSGVRIIELAGIGPVPFAGTMLAELSADVLRVDRPDPAAPVLPAAYDLLRRSRPSVRVDLKSPGGGCPGTRSRQLRGRAHRRQQARRGGAAGTGAR